MQTINDLTNGKTPQQLVASAQQSSETAPEKDSIRWLWGIMVSMYGHKWVSSFGADPDPDRVWASCLKGISPEQIKTGLNQCALLALEWPPSAPQFRALCLGLALDDDGNDASWQHRIHASRALETDNADGVKYTRNAQGELVVQRMLPDKTKRERAVAARNIHAERLKSMFAGTGQ
jgi:hypothetical protein